MKNWFNKDSFSLGGGSLKTPGQYIEEGYKTSGVLENVNMEQAFTLSFNTRIRRN